MYLLKCYEVGGRLTWLCNELKIDMLTVVMLTDVTLILTC